MPLVCLIIAILCCTGVAKSAFWRYVFSALLYLAKTAAPIVTFKFNGLFILKKHPIRFPTDLNDECTVHPAIYGRPRRWRGGHIRIIGHVTFPATCGNIEQPDFLFFFVNDIRVCGKTIESSWSRGKIIHKERCQNCLLPCLLLIRIFCVNVWCRHRFTWPGKREGVRAC